MNKEFEKVIVAAIDDETHDCEYYLQFAPLPEGVTVKQAFMYHIYMEGDFPWHGEWDAFADYFLYQGRGDGCYFSHKVDKGCIVVY